MNVAQFLEASARHLPERVALVFGDRTWTYAELDRQASCLAAGLGRLGLTSGEGVCLHLPNRPEFVLAYYACQKLGLTPVALNVTFKRNEIAYIVRDSQAAAILSAEPASANLPPVPETPAVRVRVGTSGPGAVAFAALSADRPLPACDLDRDDVAAILSVMGRPSPKQS